MYHELVVNVASSWSRGIRRKYHYCSILESSCGFVEKPGRHSQHGKNVMLADYPVVIWLGILIPLQRGMILQSVQCIESGNISNE